MKNKKRKTYDILAENIERICSVDELKEMMKYNNICELDEFIENNKNIEASIGNTDLFNIYKNILKEKINKIK